MRASRQITAVFGVLLIACIAGSVLLLRGLDRLRSHATLEEVLYIPSPKAIKRLSLGYDGLLADIYWTRAVQYFGNKHNVGAENFNLLAPLLEITTALDPHLVVAYEYGSNFLAPHPPNGAGMPDRAIKLDEFGIRNNPDEWIARLCSRSRRFFPWVACTACASLLEDTGGTNGGARR